MGSYGPDLGGASVGMRDEIRPEQVVQRVGDKVSEGSISEIGHPGKWWSRVTQAMEFQENGVGIEIRMTRSGACIDRWSVR